MDARVEKGQEQTTEIQNQQNLQNWSEQVEDLIAGGDTEQAITVLEAVVSNLEIHTPSETTDLLHASALSDLAKLYSSKSFSLKSEDLKSRAYLLKQRALRYSPSNNMQILQEDSTKGTEASHSGIGLSSADGTLQGSTTSVDDPNSCDGSPNDGTSEDDWEAIVDRTPEELLSIHCTPAPANMALEDTKSPAPKQRGRGTFSYKKHELYSDRSVYYSSVDDVKSEDGTSEKEDDLLNLRQTKYGTRHVLVLANFSASMRTVDLENLFQDFRDRSFVIRWVNDTTALAVFRTPSIALEAFNSVQCPFTVRVLDGHEVLLGSISPRDLEPPRQRPKTSVRTAQRLIAQGMGLKLTSTTFGSQELKSQEEARKHRITTRQKMKDDAWGVDE